MDDEIANPTPLPADRSLRTVALPAVGTDATARGGPAVGTDAAARGGPAVGTDAAARGGAAAPAPLPPEIGGPTGPEPTRYGDWERKGRCYDF